MPKSWRDYSPGDAPNDPYDNSDNSDKSPADGAETRPIVPIVTNVTGLPADVRRGLTWLANAPAPRARRPEIWPQIVADALRIASEGWAVRAMGLGWSPLDLFGAVPQMRGDPAGDGLAVRLDGRRILALCGSFATVKDANGGRAYLYRPKYPAARLLWALGNGR